MIKIKHGDIDPRKIIEKIDDFTQILLLLLMVLLVLLQIVLRLVNHPFPWTEEITRHLFIWTVFISVGTGVRLKEHLGISFIVNLVFKGKNILLQRLYNVIVSIVFYLLIIKLGIDFTIQIFNLGQKATTYGILMGFITMAIPFGFSMALIWSFYELAEIITEIFNKDKILKEK